jgi:quercetin dioxygenase-like cupin family protein
MLNPAAPFRVALRERNLRLLLGGLAVSQAGDWLYNLVADTSLQRSLDPAVLARAYGFVVPANLAGIAGGALLAPLFVACVGFSGSLVIVGATVIAYSALVLAHSGSPAASASPSAESLAAEAWRAEDPLMTDLNHTQTIDRPYISLESEARWYGNSLWEHLVPADATGGKLSVFEATMPEGFSPPRHIHTREDEVFLVLDGEAWFDIDGERQLAGPGTSVYMPRGVPHTFRVKSPVARMLGIMTPGAFEQLFRNLSFPAAERTLPEPGTVPFDVPAVMAEQIRLGTQVVGPPMAAEEA